jgi:CRP-like cAMP-binding protein
VAGEHPNFLLQAIRNAGIKALEPHLSTRKVSQGQQIADTGETVPLVYFPHAAVLSCVVGLEGGGAVAGGLIGKDGAFGALQVLDSMVALNKVFVMVPGVVSVVEARHLTSAADQFPALRRILLGYEQYFLAQVQQTAACNALHDIPMRTCRWLLRLEQLAGSEFPLTHDALSLMMGVRRTSVTQVAGKMQESGLLSYHRGTMKLIDVRAMRKVACECHRALEDHYDQIFRRITGRANDLSPNMQGWEQQTYRPNVDHQSDN